jgi:hypothetical protein
MSIVTLKRKSDVRSSKHSVPGLGFSLNGVSRFIGVGNTRMGRSVTSTPFKGTVPKGHGGGARCTQGVKQRATGCDNTVEYPISIVRSGQQVQQTTVKVSTMNTKGYIEKSYNMQMLNKNGCHWVKENGLDQSELLRISIVKPEPATCKTANANGCPIKPTGYTKAAVGPLSYDQLYMRRDWKTRSCMIPSWPPRINNSQCANSTPLQQPDTILPCGYKKENVV